MTNNKKTLVYGVCIASILGLSACGGSNDSSSVTVEGDVAIAYVKRANTVPMNPTDAGEFRSGGNLYVREKSSPSSPEYNITAQVTAGQGDVSRPEVSYDGKKIVFAMRCSANTPCSGGSTTPLAQQDLTWSIWEYDFSKTSLDKGTLRRVMSLENARRGDDYDPAYLPGNNGFVFTSRIQDKSSAKSGSGPRYPGQPGYVALDEYEREGVANLHTMNVDGSNIQQISFNQSHDRSPTVLQNGRIMYARWDHVAGRNHFSIFTVKPDGTDMFVFYGAHSAGNSRLHPREMQNGKVVTDQMPLSGTQEGGALMLLDVLNYSEQNTPANDNVPTTGGQQQATKETMEFGSRSISVNGRVTTPYPLWDGSNRVLVAYTPCQVTRNNVITACAELTDAERARLSENRLQAAINADEIKNNAPVAYSIQMFDMDTQKWRTVVPAASGFMYKDPVALMARKEPNILPVASATTPGPQVEIGTLSVRSVYDTDGLGRMGNAVLSSSELSSNAIPRVGGTVADIAALKDPANPAYKNRPARFVRITRAVATPAGSTGMREAIGETEFEMQQIVGYADVEPDGSIKIDVPADIPLTLSVTDAQGRAFQSHTNWLQIRPGEQRTCNGCHSPRRGAALNSGALLNNPVSHPNTSLASAIGETMADTRFRATPSARMLKSDIDYTDVWAITPQAATPCTSLRYTGNKRCDGTADTANDLATPIPVNGIINYPEHIQPLWERARPAGSCVSCHSDPIKLDLRRALSATGRFTSYQELLVGDANIVNGVPQTRIVNGAEVVVLGPARINNMASQGDAVGLARKSRLMEILSGEDLMASATARTTFPTPGAAAPAGTPNHATLLNAAEKRLLAEWIDLGAQYYNDPFNSNGSVRVVNGLSRADFDNATASNGQRSIHSVLLETCGSCHQAGGNDSTSPAPTFENNRFVLTGSSEGDFNLTLSMVNNVCAPDTNYLLYRPSNLHPTASPTASIVLPQSSADYTRIRSWIAAGCTP